MQRALSPAASSVCRVVFLVVLAAFMQSAIAQQSYFRLYDQTTGLNVGQIAALAQDETGFIWIGAHRGLVRFDGHNFIAWAPDQVDELVNRIILGPGDELLVGTARGRAWRRAGSSLEPLIGPDAASIANLAAFDFDARGDLWAILGRDLWRRDASQRWQRIDHGIPAQETPRFVRAIGDDVVVLTDQAAWRLRNSNPAEIVLREPHLWSVAGNRQSPLWLVTHFGRLWRVDAEGASEVATPHSRVLDLRMRGSTLWLSLDTQLVAIGADGHQRRMGIEDGLPSGGPLFVDRESSLWLGSFVGLVQFPEPDTWQWGLHEGLPSMHVHALAEAESAIWVSAWVNGLTRIDERTGQLTLVDTEIPAGEICTTGKRGIWTLDGRHILAWDKTHFRTVADLPVPAQLTSCVVDNVDNLWLATTANLLRLASAAVTPATIKLDRNETFDLVWLDGDQLFVANQAHACRLRPAGDSAALEDCIATDMPRDWISQARIGQRRDWLTATDGLFEYDGEHLRRLRGNHDVEGGIIQKLSPAPNGDWWAAGAGVLMRIHSCAACESGFRIKETPGLWQGVPGDAALDVVETSSGDLWIAGNRGVWRVLHAVRGLPTQAPSIVLVHAQIDADARPPAAAIELRPQDHRLELEFAALSFRDPSLLRYRWRLGVEGAWSAPVRDPHLQFAALEPGAYHAVMSASLDGVHWSASPATVEFTVLPPWYRTVWARIAFAVATIGLLAWMYRLRVAALLRVESERTRIAMDLHDEIGAGLGSIGMLAGAAARTRADAEEQQRIVREIGDVSNLLGSGLRSLVWSLRSSKAGVGELGEQIADHARRLFPGREPQLTIRLPGADATLPLAPQERRHLLLFALEALHNVSRHAHANRVNVSLEAMAQSGLRLLIEDDGRGFDSKHDARGTGLASMRRRAAAIHAEFDLASAPGNGTRIALTYPAPPRHA